MSLLALLAHGTTPPPPIVYNRTDTGVAWLGTDPSGTVWGCDPTTSEWCTTTDGTNITRLGTTANATIGIRPVDVTFGGGYMWAHTPGSWGSVYGVTGWVPAGTGKVWRTPIGNLTGWVDVTPSGWVAATCGRNSIMAHDGATLLVGQYSYNNSDAWVWRSPDNGATWTYQDLGGGSTRHIHAVHWDPGAAGVAWATVGDSVGAPRGLYRSADSGQTWTRVASSQYPIDFAWLSDGSMVMEGDGVGTPHVVGYVDGASDFTAEITPAMAESATGQTNWNGTTRCIAALPGDRIFYTTTAEGGATGRRYGIWAATRGGGAAWEIELLEELAAPWVVMSTTQVLPDGSLLAYRYHVTLT